MNKIWNKIALLYYYYFVVLFLYFCCCCINFIVCFLCWYCVANNNATANKIHQPGDWRLQKSYLLNPKNSKTYLILFQPIMCQKCILLFPRAHFLGATCALTEPAHEIFSKPPYCHPLLNNEQRRNQTGQMMLPLSCKLLCWAWKELMEWRVKLITAEYEGYTM